MTRPRKPSLTWVSSTARKVFGKGNVRSVSSHNIDGLEIEVSVNLYGRSPGILVRGRGHNEAFSMALAALSTRLSIGPWEPPPKPVKKLTDRQAVVLENMSRGQQYRHETGKSDGDIVTLRRRLGPTE